MNWGEETCEVRCKYSGLYSQYIVVDLAVQSSVVSNLYT